MLPMVISPEAARDLDDIWLYLARKSGIDRAESLLAKIGDGFKLARTFPGGGSDRSSLKPGMRSYPVGNYLVFFAREARHVSIVRVLHGARNPAKIFKRRRKRDR